MLVGEEPSVPTSTTQPLTSWLVGGKQGGAPLWAKTTRRRAPAIDARPPRHAGYKVSQIKRKRIEEPFGWMKTVVVMRKTRHRGRKLVEWFFVLAAAAYNLIRIPKILAVAG